MAGFTTSGGTPVEILSQIPTVAIVGPGVTRSVVEVAAVEDTHNVGFTVYVPQIVWQDHGLRELVGIYADQIAAIMDYGGVVDAAYRQTVTEAGQILGWLDVYVSPDEGENVGVVTFPFGGLDFARVQPLIDWMFRVVQANIDGTTPPKRPSTTGVGGSGVPTGGGV